MAPVKSAKCTRKGAALACAARTTRRQQEVWGRSYVDALRTVHLAGGEAVTVSSGLADNMAKGIHLQRRARAHKRSGQTKALDNKDSRAQRKVRPIGKGYRKQEKVTNSRAADLAAAARLITTSERTRRQERAQLG